MQGPSAVTPACQRRHKRKQAAAAGRRQAVGQLGSRITYIVSARNIRRGISPAHRVAAWGHRLVALSPVGASGWRWGVQQPTVHTLNLSSSESDCGKIDMEGEGRKGKGTENGDLIPNVRAEEQIMVQNQNEAVRDWSVRSEQPRGRRRGRAAGRQRWGAAGRLCPWRGRPHRASSSGR